MGKHQVVIEREKLIQVRVDGTYVGGGDSDKIGKSGGGLEEGEECDEGE